MENSILEKITRIVDKNNNTSIIKYYDEKDFVVAIRGYYQNNNKKYTPKKPFPFYWITIQNRCISYPSIYKIKPNLKAKKYNPNSWTKNWELASWKCSFD